MHPKIAYIVNTLGSMAISRGEVEAIERALDGARRLGKGPPRTYRCRNGHERTDDNTARRTSYKNGRAYVYVTCLDCRLARTVTGPACVDCTHPPHEAECWHRDPVTKEYDCDCIR